TLSTAIARGAARAATQFRASTPSPTAATNANDTVPRYLQGGEWAPKATQATLSNAMDVSQPNNWPRVEELFRRKIWRLSELGYAAVDDETTKAAMRELKAIGY
ncbi:hypothetical protein LAN14_22735, partial [Mycobacterium tuberculosis]|nr:hypothetical protein [Mycobacterium tuberculosis]